MTRILPALAGGLVLGLALAVSFGAAFCFGVWPVSAILDRDTIHAF